MDAAALRSQFPVLAERAYLNAGTFGPLPQAAVDAAAAVTETALRAGRVQAYYETMLDVRDRLRAAYASRLGAAVEDVALTTSTSEGIVRVLGGLDLGPGDEVLTAPDEHPGLLGPLVSLRTRRGVSVRAVPFSDLAAEVRAETKLVACSHVSWIDGSLRPEGLRDAGVPVLLDGAQGIGAVDTDVTELGCDFYAGSGQKWLCGPAGTGSLWISPEWRDRVAEIGATYINLEDPSLGVDAVPYTGGRRHDTFSQSVEALAAALAAFDVLDAHGFDAVIERAATLAETLAKRLADAGRTVAPRGPTTLVSWEDADPEATRARLAERDVLIRNLPGTPYLRASVGAWNDESDLDRLLAAL